MKTYKFVFLLSLITFIFTHCSSDSKINIVTYQEMEPPKIVAEIPEYKTYILNNNTRKFHRETCCYVDKIKDSNKEYYTGERDEIIEEGFLPCKKCFP